LPLKIISVFYEFINDLDGFEKEVNLVECSGKFEVSSNPQNAKLIE